MSAWRGLTLKLWILNPPDIPALVWAGAYAPYLEDSVGRVHFPCDLLRAPEHPQCQLGPTPGYLTKQEFWGISAASWVFSGAFLSGHLLLFGELLCARWVWGLCSELPCPLHSPSLTRSSPRPNLRWQEQEKEGCSDSEHPYYTVGWSFLGSCCGRESGCPCEQSESFPSCCSLRNTPILVSWESHFTVGQPAVGQVLLFPIKLMYPKSCS